MVCPVEEAFLFFCCCCPYTGSLAEGRRLFGNGGMGQLFKMGPKLLMPGTNGIGIGIGRGTHCDIGLSKAIELSTLFDDVAPSPHATLVPSGTKLFISFNPSGETKCLPASTTLVSGYTWLVVIGTGGSPCSIAVVELALLKVK